MTICASTQTRPDRQLGQMQTAKNRIHEIKHDGYRLIVQRDGNRVRLFHPQRLRLERPSCSLSAYLEPELIFRHSPQPSRSISAIARSISAIPSMIFAIPADLDATTDHKRALQRLARPGCNCCKSNCLICPSKGGVFHETRRCFSLGFDENRLCPTRDPPFFDGKTASIRCPTEVRQLTPLIRNHLAVVRQAPRLDQFDDRRRVWSRRASSPRSPRAGLRYRRPSPPSASSRRSRPRA